MSGRGGGMQSPAIDRISETGQSVKFHSNDGATEMQIADPGAVGLAGNDCNGGLYDPDRAGAASIVNVLYLSLALIIAGVSAI